MARETSRTLASSFTQDLRTSPKWYQRRTTPFYVSRPSARMEKQLADIAERQWLGQISEPRLQKQCIKGHFMPWASYARSSARLKLALKGHDAVNLPNNGMCNSDCATFMCCFPFYGVLIAQLQSTVRAFYDIDGSEAQDHMDGCCCPCFALVRTENEIIFREARNAQAKNISELKLPEKSGSYTAEAPMEVLTSMILQPNGPPRARSSSASSSKGKDIERTSQSLSTIPEVSREVSGACETDVDGRNQQVSARKVAKPHELKSDSTVMLPALNSTFPILNYLDKQWFLVPAGNLKENAKPEEGLTEILDELPGGTQQPDRGMWNFFRRRKVLQAADPTIPHVLADDTASARMPTRILKHKLAEDELVHKSQKSRFAEHLIEQDNLSPSMVPTINVSHEVANDPVFPLPANPMAGRHALPEHQPTLVKRAEAISRHSLEGDEAMDKASDPQASSQDDAEAMGQDKGFVATFLKGFAQPLRSAPTSPAPAETSNSEETPQTGEEANGDKAVGGVIGPELGDNQASTR